MTAPPAKRRLAAPLAALLWLLVGALLLLLAGRLQLRTDVLIVADQAGLRFTVAGTTVAVPEAPQQITSVLATAMDSVVPQGDLSIRIESDGRVIADDRRPGRFDLPEGRVVPLGDWFVDRVAGFGRVYERRFDPVDTLEIRAEIKGRSLQFTTFSLHGRASKHCRFRRGLINNDLCIADNRGVALVTTNIEPRPLQRVAAAAATLLMAAAVGSLLIAAFTLIRWATSKISWPCTKAGGITPRRALVAAIVLALAALALSSWVALAIFEKLPHVPDSVAYLVQAGWLLDGRISAEVTELQEHLKIPFTFVSGERWLVQYPVGWPLLLAAGLAAGVPWLVSPLLGGLYTLLIALVGRELYSPALGLTAALLALVSPLTTLICASHMSHAASGTLILLFIWLFLVGRRRRSTWLLTAAGLALGYAFGIRPLTAVAVAIPFGILVLEELRSLENRSNGLRQAGALTLGGLLGATPTFISNLLLSGDPLTFPYSLAQGGGFYSLDNLGHGLRNLDTLLIHTVPALYGWGWPMLQGTAVLALPLALATVPFLLRRQLWADKLMVLLFLNVALAHLGTQWNGLHGLGPRYYFEVLFCLFLLTARGFAELASLGNGKRSGLAPLGAALLFVVLNLQAITVLPSRLNLYRGYNSVDGSLERAIVERRIDRALVVFSSWQWYDWGRAARMMRPGQDADLVFATSREDDRALLEHYADRPAWLWDHGNLVPYRLTEQEPPADQPSQVAQGSGSR